MNKPIPRQPLPPLEFPTLDGAVWRPAAAKPAHFDMLVVYRGLHCPVCKGYLKELAGLLPEFAARGVAVTAASSDVRERAQAARDDWALGPLSLGYGLPLDAARAWGLYVSSSRGKSSLGIEEPAHFVEPGLFLIRPDATLYASVVATMPFARPHFRDVLAALDFVIKNDYPARGEA